MIKTNEEIDSNIDAIFIKASPPKKFQSVGEKEKFLKKLLKEYAYSLVRVEKNCFSCGNGEYNQNFRPCGKCNDTFSEWVERTY